MSFVISRRWPTACGSILDRGTLGWGFKIDESGVGGVSGSQKGICTDALSEQDVIHGKGCFCGEISGQGIACKGPLSPFQALSGQVPRAKGILLVQDRVKYSKEEILMCQFKDNA